MQLKLSLAAALAASGVAVAAIPAHAQTVTYQRLLAADSEPQNWLLYGQNYKNWRYSTLTQVNKGNVQNLKMAFMFSIGRDGKADGAEEGTPLVEDGFMYVTNTWSKLMKVDVRSGTRGTPVWRFDPKSEFTRSNKGPALLGDNVYITTNDVRLFAVNKTTGEAITATLGGHIEGYFDTVAGVLAVTIAMNLLAFPYSALVAPIGKLVFHVSPILVGILAASESCGGFMGGLLLTAREPPRTGRILMVGGSLLMLTCVMMMPMAPP